MTRRGTNAFGMTPIPKYAKDGSIPEGLPRTGTLTPQAIRFITGNQVSPVCLHLTCRGPTRDGTRTNGEALDFDHEPRWDISFPPGEFSAETGRDTVGAKDPFLE